MKTWFLKELIGPVARRVGGQASAALVAVGMATQHEAAVSAAIAWLIITGAEVATSAKARDVAVKKAKGSWGQN